MKLYFWILYLPLISLTACNFNDKSQEFFFKSANADQLSGSETAQLSIITQEFGEEHIAILKLNNNWRKHYNTVNIREEVLFNYLNNYYLLSSTYHPSLIAQKKASKWHGQTSNELSGPKIEIFEEISKYSIISFIATEDGLQGSGFVADQKFYIRPLGNNYHAFIAANKEQIPYNDHDEDELEDELEDNASVPQSTDIKILHIITNKAKQRITERYTKKADQYIDQLVDHSNQTLKTQNINLTISNAGIHFVDYKPVNSKIDVARLAGEQDGFLDAIHKLRNDVQADVVSLIVENHNGNKNSCGRVRKINSSYQNAFFTVRYDCAFGKFSYLHEIGHLAGCRHNPEADNKGTYNHGHFEVSQKWRSVMSYDCCTDAQKLDPKVPKPCCTRHPTWSDPNLKLPNGKLKGLKNVSENVKIWKGGDALAVANLHENRSTSSTDLASPEPSLDATSDEAPR